MKKVLSVILAAAMLLTTAVFAHAQEEIGSGDVIEFGSYPQTHVTDEALIAELNEKLTADNWTSLEFHESDMVSDSQIMEDANYQDVVFNGEKYRAVLCERRRPVLAGSSLTPAALNGYAMGTVHWFLFEPIRWTVLDAAEGFLCSEMILESRAVCDMLYYDTASGTKHPDPELTAEINNYQASSIRQWLNTSFLSSAFDPDEQNVILMTEVDNSINAYGEEEYSCPDTTDKVFLPGAQEVCYEGYFPDNASRMKKYTDYAAMEGIAPECPNFDEGYNHWFLRTPGNIYNTNGFVSYDGRYSAGILSQSNDAGIVPAICVDLAALASLGEDDEGPTFAFADGILFADGEGELSAATLPAELTAIASDVRTVMIGSEITSVAEGTFAGFGSLATVVADGKTAFAENVFPDSDALNTVVLRDAAVFAEDTFNGNTDIALYEKNDKPHGGTLAGNVTAHSYSYSDGTLSVDGDVQLGYYSFFDLLAVFCMEYEEINVLDFGSLTSSEMYFRYYSEEKEQYVVIPERTIGHPSFTAALPSDGENVRISFNELCERVADGSVDEFYLVTSAEGYEDIADIEVEVHESFLLRALKWIVGLLNYIFTVFTKIFG